MLYSQLSAFGGNSDGDASQKTATVPGSRDAYAALIQKMKETADSHGANLIILHHATLSILEDGSAKVTSDQTLRQTFTSICSENEIPFVDMSETFINKYNENHVLPHGFINTSVGSGHLNKHGHKMIAAALYELVGEV